MLAFSEVASSCLSRFHPDFPRRFTPGAIRLLKKRRHADTGKAQREPGYRPTGTLATCETVGDNVHFAYDTRVGRGRISGLFVDHKQHHYALTGFGGGKHACMGKNFACMQLKAIWTVLLDRFDFLPGTRFPRPNYGSWVTGPETPCRVRYRRRSEPGVFQ